MPIDAIIFVSFIGIVVAVVSGAILRDTTMWFREWTDLLGSALRPRRRCPACGWKRVRAFCARCGAAAPGGRDE